MMILRAGATILVLMTTAAAARQDDPRASGLLGRFDEHPAERAGERVVGGEALVPVTVDGRPLRLRIEPSVPGLPVLAPAVAASLGLKSTGFFKLGVCFRVGHENTCGATQVVGFGWDGEKPGKRRVAWMSRPYVPAADGSIGPAGVPERIVRFALHAPRAGETVVTLPMAGGTGLFGGWFVIDGLATIGGQPMRVRFDPHRPRSLASAVAAVAIAGAHHGVMTAETGRQEIAFGIERPFRVMRLATPLAIGGVSLDRIGVRVTDGDIAGRIAEEGAAPEAADPDEVVVTGRRRKPRPGILILAADALARCSSIVFDKPARQIRLSCGS